ncbi:hypothetical protein [Pseudolysinimonas sp.]|uniref:hypothetical protein n=1 Tax=Pseudolysinimonas sp. TaxID=2680009 RepID=UPI003F7F4687
MLDQAGGLACAWGGEDRTDSTYNTGLTLTLLPDATADFAAFQRDPYLNGNNAPTVGAASVIHCNGPQAPCLGDVLVGATWLEFTYSDAGRAADPTSAVVALLTSIASRVQGLIPAPHWEPPASAASAVDCSDAAGSALVGIPVSSTPQDPGLVSLGSAAARRAGVVGCEWGAEDAAASAAVGLLPGGAWAFAPMAATSPAVPLVGPLVPSSVEWSDGALSGCGDGCDGIISVRGSLVFVNAAGVDPAGFPAMLSRVRPLVTSG